MTQIFVDANGGRHEFPDDATPQEIDSATRSLPSKNKNTFEPVKEPGFAERIAPNILAGLAQGGHEILNAPHNIANLISPKLANRIPKQQEYDFAKLLKLPTGEKASLSDKLIRGGAEILPGIVAPELRIGSLSKVPYVGKLAQKVVGNAIPAAGFAAIQNPESPLGSAETAAGITAPFSAASSIAESTNPYVKLAGRVVLGALGAGLGYKAAETIAPGLGSYAEIPAAIAGSGLAMIGKTPQNLARENMLKGVSETPFENKLQAAERLGLSYLTPAEASGNPFVASHQGAAGKTEKGSQILYKKGLERVESERKSISNLFNEIHDEEKLGPEISALYKESHQQKVPQELVDNLKKNEIIKAAIKKVQSKPAYRESLKNIPENSIAYLDHVKQALDDLIEEAPEKEARIMRNTKNIMLSKMDKISPKFARARSLAEREITRSKIEEKLNEGEIKGTSFYNKILKNDKSFRKLMFSLRNVPKAQEQLKDMRLVFRDLINPPTVRTAAGLAKTGMTQERNSKLAFGNYLRDIISNGRYDTAAVEIMTDPKWAQELKNISQIKNGHIKTAKTIDMLGRASALGTTRKEPMTLELNKFAGYQ